MFINEGHEIGVMFASSKGRESRVIRLVDLQPEWHRLPQYNYALWKVVFAGSSAAQVSCAMLIGPPWIW